MYFLTGFTDEAADSIEDQIRVVQDLGWDHLELRTVDGVNLHDLSPDDFERVRRTIESSGLQVSCLGSNIANWGTPVETPLAETMEIVDRVIKRAAALKTSRTRIMSYALRLDDKGNVLAEQNEKERFEKLIAICGRLLDNGVTPVHENCFTYGGMSWKHALRLLEEVPGMKLAFDTGNPPLQVDYAGPEPRPMQSSWEFYTRVRPHIEYVHIKDAIYDPKTKEELYRFPDEGAGDVKRIVQDLLQTGYQGGFSMEPHMAVVYHDSSVTAEKSTRFENFSEYGRRFVQILSEIGFPYSRQE